MKKLMNKVAIVTGASKGIGAAIAKSLAHGGASVIVNYASSRESAELVVSEIEAAGGKAFAVKGDVSRAEDVKAVVDATIQQFGGLDILVNNSGVYEYGSLAEFKEAAFHRIFNVDVLGLLLVTREAVARMRDGGSIINIGSLASTANMPGTLIYAAAKHAVDGITKVLAKELGPRAIRVNAVNPGLVETEGTRAAGFFGGGSDTTGFAANAPLGQAGKSEDVAHIVAFLASDESLWISGQTLVANGPQ